MPIRKSGDKPYTQVIDLTSKAQREARNQRTRDSLANTSAQRAPTAFDDLSKRVHEACKNAGWTDLMPVQQKAIPYLLAGEDLIVQSRTGSGKTGAFLLPLFESLHSEDEVVQALVMTPTRELARQIYQEFVRLNGNGPFRAAPVYGGVKYGPQINALKKGVHMVIGTPGRILDHLDRGVLSLESLRYLVLDEADEMLSMGFYPAMKALHRYLPAARHSFMFSATIPPKVKYLANQFLDDPGFLSLSIGHVGVDEIAHHYYVADPMQKDRVLVRCIELENPDSAIVFANTKRDVEYVATFLSNYGHDAEPISSNLSQRERERVMERINSGELRFLVATDVAARGIDISDLTHVIMFDVPQDPEYYVHRSGRTGRAGNTGTAIVIATNQDEQRLQRIARNFGIDMEKRDVPSEEDVEKRVAERMTVVLEERLRAKSNLEKERMRRFVPLAKGLSDEEPELIAMMLDELYHQMLHRRVDEMEPSADDSDTSNAAGKGKTKRSDRKR